jgi:hypothetical protein
MAEEINACVNMNSLKSARQTKMIANGTRLVLLYAHVLPDGKVLHVLTILMNVRKIRARIQVFAQIQKGHIRVHVTMDGRVNIAGRI